jgi:hypothetical protein
VSRAYRTVVAVTDHHDARLDHNRLQRWWNRLSHAEKTDASRIASGHPLPPWMVASLRDVHIEPDDLAEPGGDAKAVRRYVMPSVVADFVRSIQ